MWCSLLSILVLSAGLFVSVVEAQGEACRNDNEIINQILLTYDKKIAPRERSGGPGRIDVDVSSQDFYRLDRGDNELKLDLYISTTWSDERLRYAHLRSCKCLFFWAVLEGITQ